MLGDGNRLPLPVRHRQVADKTRYQPTDDTTLRGTSWPDAPTTCATGEDGARVAGTRRWVGSGCWRALRRGGFLRPSEFRCEVLGSTDLHLSLQQPFAITVPLHSVGSVKSPSRGSMGAINVASR